MTSLPVASPQETRRHAWRIVVTQRRSLIVVVLLYAVATSAALIGPWTIGRLVNHAVAGTLRAASITSAVSIMVAATLVAATFTYFARRASYVVGERVFAVLREDFLRHVLRLPLAEVERAGTGDLLSRTTNDVEALSRSVRFAVPEWLVAIVQLVTTVVAAIIVSPLVAVAAVVVVPALVLSTRRYLRYAGPGYFRERVGYATMFGVMAETTNGARTVDSLQLAPKRNELLESAIRETFFAELYTLSLRLWWFPITETNYAFAVAVTLLWGGWLNIAHHVTLGAATTVTLYVVQLTDPLDRIVMWFDDLQIGQTSLARLIGVGNVRDTRAHDGAEPTSEHIEITDVHYAYRRGCDVLHGVSLSIRPGERLAIVGPSGAGKSTLGRLIAGIDVPRSGTITIGETSVAELSLATIRQHVALVTQEHHVFIGTVAENVALARADATTEEIREALAAVDALEWVEALPQGLHTTLGDADVRLTPAQAQQIALARLVLVNPHTLVLDEATSLLDPRAARHLERSLAAVLSGRTVIAIAHRLHTAHDADRVAVVMDGRIAELGTHDELLARNGEYAQLWRSWQSEGADPS